MILEANSSEENSILDAVIRHDETDSPQVADNNSVRRSSRQRNPPDCYGDFYPVTLSSLNPTKGSDVTLNNCCLVLYPYFM